MKQDKNQEIAKIAKIISGCKLFIKCKPTCICPFYNGAKDLYAAGYRRIEKQEESNYEN